MTRDRGRRLRPVLAALIPVLAIAGAGCGGEEGTESSAARSGEPTSADEGGDAAPDFTLPSLDGRQVSLSSFRGKTVILDFWATWCPPCVFQVPELNRLFAAHRERGDVVVIGVSVDVDGAEVVEPWIQEHGVEYEIVLGSVELAERFGAVGFPTLAVVTPDGRLDSLHVGLIEYDALEDLVAKTATARST
jgi:peroxiredoxin